MREPSGASHLREGENAMRVTQEEFSQKLKHDYAETKPDGSKWMLWMEKPSGATVWGEVTIVPATEPLEIRELMKARHTSHSQAAEAKFSTDAETCHYCGVEGIVPQSYLEDRAFCGACYPTLYRYLAYREALKSQGPMTLLEWLKMNANAEEEMKTYWRAVAQMGDVF